LAWPLAAQPANAEMHDACCLFKQPPAHARRRDDCCVFMKSMRETYRPLFFIKTNLLYDLALSPNIGVEVPIGDRYSVEAGFMRGWWLARDWSFCWQAEEMAMLEGRYWFSGRTERHLRGGWFGGVLVQAGFYDFQFDRSRGLQGEALTAGVTGGYVRPLGGDWSLEFSLGLGVLITDYRRYTVVRYTETPDVAEEHVLVRRTPDVRYTGVLYPIKAGISLLWAFSWSKSRRWAP
jgi:hypothetical protein